MGNKKYRKAGGSSSKPSAAEKSRGRAPELKGVEFTYGKNSDAAGYDKVRFNLVRHVAVQNWPGADKASIALETGLKPMLVEPTAPTIPQLKYLAKVKKTQPDGSEVEVEELVDYTEMELWVEKEKYYRANKKYESDEKEYRTNKKNWEENQSRMFNLVMQHCSDELETKLQATDKWADMNRDRDVLRLMVVIKTITHQHDDTKQGTMALVDSIVRLYNYVQDNAKTSDYHDGFKAHVDTIDAYDGAAGFHPGLCKKHIQEIMTEQIAAGIDVSVQAKKEEIEKEGRERAIQEFLGCLFIRMADEKRFGKLKDDLSSQWAMGNDGYPKSLAAALKLLTATEENLKSGGTDNNTNKEMAAAGLSFTQTGGPVNGPDDKVKCFTCGGPHYASQCPKSTQAEKDELYSPEAKSKRAALRGSSKKGVNQLTTDAAEGTKAGGLAAALAGYTPERIEEATQLLNVLRAMDAHDEEASNDGVCGALIGLPSPEQMAGVTLLAPRIFPEEDHPRKKVSFAVDKAEQDALSQRVTLCAWKLYLDSCATYHSAFVDWMLSDIRIVSSILRGNCNAGVTSTNVKGVYELWEFWLNKKGIANLLSIPQLEKDGFEIDYNTKRDWVVKTPAGKTIVFKRDTGLCEGMPYIDMREHQDAFAMVQTVRKNFEGFTRRQVKKAILARELQAKVAHPSDQQFKRMVSQRSLKKSRITPQAIAHARTIFGQNRSGLRGFTVRAKPERVEPDFVEIPRDFYRLHKFVTLVGDVMFVDG